jgi:hypothetical protein
MMRERPSLVDMMRSLLDYIAWIEQSINHFAKYVREHKDEIIKISSPEELEAFAWYGLISYEDIPPEKRTKFVQNRLKK